MKSPIVRSSDNLLTVHELHGLSHTKILSKELSGSRRCTKLGSRSSPGSEQRRRANR